MNHKGFSDTITVAIISAFVGAIFIGGVSVWGEIKMIKQIDKTPINSANLAPEQTDTPINVDEFLEDYWQRYMNREHDYYFDFPPNWIPGPAGFDRTANVFMIADRSPERVRNITFSGDLWPYRDDKCDDLRQCADMFIESRIGRGNTGWEIVSDENIKLADQDAISQMIERKEHGWSHWYIYFIHNDKFFVISTISDFNEFDADKVMFDKILATFNFIDRLEPGEEVNF